MKVKTSAFHKTYQHEYHPLVNTTSNFGTLQPVFSRLLAKGESISINYNLLTRCAPMVCPTFGHYYTHVQATFVPSNLVFPAYESVRSQTTYKGKSIFRLPLISNRALFVAMVMTNCFNVHYIRRHDSIVEDPNWYLSALSTTSTNLYYPSFTNLKSICSQLFTDYTAYNDCCFDFDLESFSEFDPIPLGDKGTALEQFGSQVDLSSFDVVIGLTDRPISSKVTLITDSDALGTAINGVVFRLNDNGKTLLKLLRGVGYNPLNYNDGDILSAMPLLSLHKALFDLNAVQRTLNYTDTALYKATQSFTIQNSSEDTGNIVKFGSQRVGTILKEMLSYAFDLNATDYFSAASSEVGAINRDMFATQTIEDYTENDPSADLRPLQGDLVIDSGKPHITDSSNVNSLSAIAIQTLLKMTRFVNANTLLGNSVAKVLGSLGYDVNSIEYANTARVFEKKELISVDEVYSTSNTYDGTDGSELGAYAGRGMSFKRNTIDYRATTDGFFIIWYSIIPRIGWCLGNNPSLYAVNAYNLKNPMWDGLGYESISPSQIEQNLSTGYVGYCNNDYTQPVETQSFGFMPRLSIHKFCPDILNGDMSINSLMTTYAPYHDEMLIYHGIGEQESSYHKVGDWCRKPWSVFDYNRSFYTTGQFQDPSTAIYTTQNLHYDNFLVQGQFDVVEHSLLKPISDSYDVDFGESEVSVNQA